MCPDTKGLEYLNLNLNLFIKWRHNLISHGY